MNTVERTYRLDDILEILKRNKHTTQSEIASITGKTIRTIQRDIRRIKEEYPNNLVTHRGNGGGIEWIE